MTAGHLINGVGVETFLDGGRRLLYPKQEKKYEKPTEAFQRCVWGDESYFRRSNSLVVELLTQNLGEYSQTLGLMSSQVRTLIIDNECLSPHVQTFHPRAEQFFLENISL